MKAENSLRARIEVFSDLRLKKQEFQLLSGGIISFRLGQKPPMLCFRGQIV